MSFDLCFQLRLTTVILVIGELSKTCMLIHKNISLTTRQLSYELHVVPALSKDIIPILEIYRGGILFCMMSIMISFLEAH